MGVLGGALGGFAGEQIGGFVSDLAHGSCRGKHGKAKHRCQRNKKRDHDISAGAGAAVGGVAGGLASNVFKHGGKVKGKKGAPRKIIAHGGEYVLPANAKPTAAQKKIVANNRAKAKAKPKMTRRRPKKK